jgi:hypothetical protein
MEARSGGMSAPYKDSHCRTAIPVEETASRAHPILLPCRARVLVRPVPDRSLLLTRMRARHKSPPVCAQKSARNRAWYVSYCSYFFAAAFCFAHLLRCASAIFFLAEGERVLLFVVGAADADAGGRPLCLAGEEPASASRASCRRAIWPSIAVNISEVVIAPLYQDSKVIDVLLKGHARQHVRQRA